MNLLFTLWLLFLAGGACYEKFIHHHFGYSWIIIFILSIFIRKQLDQKY